MSHAGESTNTRPNCMGADLRSAPDRLRARGLSLGTPMHLLDVTTSTNDEAQRAAKDGAPHGAVWVAERQTAGRGRRGRSWLCPPGEGLLFSILLRPSCPPTRLPPLAIVIGLAVRDAVAHAAETAQVRIKWPNDVLVGTRKVAGVLVETVTAGVRIDSVIVGVGINVRTRVFPESVADIATSIALEAGAPPRKANEHEHANDFAERAAPDRADVLCDVLAGIERDLPIALSHGLAPFRSRIDAADALRDRRVRNDAGGEGVAVGIDEDGRLLVDPGDGGERQAWAAGEVQLAKEMSG